MLRTRPFGRVLSNATSKLVDSELCDAAIIAQYSNIILNNNCITCCIIYYIIYRVRYQTSAYSSSERHCCCLYKEFVMGKITFSQWPVTSPPGPINICPSSSPPLFGVEPEFLWPILAVCFFKAPSYFGDLFMIWRELYPTYHTHVQPSWFSLILTPLQPEARLSSPPLRSFK